MKTFMIVLTLQLFNCISNAHILADNDGTLSQSKKEVAAQDQSLLNYLLGILDNQTETADDVSSSGRSKRSANNYYYQNIPLAPLTSPFGFNYLPQYLQPPLRPQVPKIEIKTPHFLYPEVHKKANSILKHLYAKFNRILKPLESKTRVHGTRKPVQLRYNFNVNPSIQNAKEIDSNDLKKSNEYEPIKLKTSIHDEVTGEPFVNIPQATMLTPLSSIEVKTNKESPNMDVKHETDNMFVKTNAHQSINDKHHDVKHNELQSDGTKNDNGYSWNPIPEIVKNEVTRQLEEILRKYLTDKTNGSNGKIIKSNKSSDSIDNKKNITPNFDDKSHEKNENKNETQSKVEAKSIFGNFVGNKHIANIFIFYPNEDGESIFVKLTEKTNEKTQDSDVDKNEIVSYKENSQIAAKKEKIINNNNKNKNNTVSDTVDEIHQKEDLNENERFGDITDERDVERVELTTDSIIEILTEKPNEETQDSDVDKNEIVSYKDNSQIAAKKEETIIRNDKDENNTVTDTVDKIHRNEDFNEDDMSSDITKEKDVELVVFTTESIIETTTEKHNEETQNSEVVKIKRVYFKENSNIVAEKEHTIINNDKDENNTVTDTVEEIHQNEGFNEHDSSVNITKEKDLELVKMTTESIIETPTKKLNEEKQDTDVDKSVSVSYEEHSQIAAEKEKTIINNDKDENNTVTDTVDEIHQNEDLNENDSFANITEERDKTNETTGMDKFSTTETVTTTQYDVETTTNTIEIQTEESFVSSSEITTGYSENSTTIELTEGSNESTIEATNIGIEKVDKDKSNIKTSTVTSNIEDIISEEVV